MCTFRSHNVIQNSDIKNYNQSLHHFLKRSTLSERVIGLLASLRVLSCWVGWWVARRVTKRSKWSHRSSHGAGGREATWSPVGGEELGLTWGQAMPLEVVPLSGGGREERHLACCEDSIFLGEKGLWRDIQKSHWAVDWELCLSFSPILCPPQFHFPSC